MIAKTKGKKKFLKILIISLSSFLLFCFIAFWVITSSSFITGVILPAVSDAIDLRITADEVELSIFKSHLTAKNLVIGSGKKPLVKAEKLDGSFSLSDLIAGHMVFRDVLLDKALITISDDPAKKSPEPVDNNVAPIPQSIAKHSENEEPSKIFLDLKNIKITNSSFIFEAGKATRMELRDLNINLAELKNNETSRLALRSSVTIKSNSGITVEKGDWNMTLTAAFDDYLRPYKIKLDSKVDKLDGIINGVKINKTNLAFNIEGEGDKKSIVIKKFIFRQMDKKIIKSNLELSSYINFDPFSIKGKIKITPLSSELSSVLCQFARQINPGKVGMSLISDFEYSEDYFSAAGDLRIVRKNDAIIAGKRYKLPDLTLKSKYNFKFDNAQQALHVKYLSTELKDRDRKVLSLSADRAFTYFFSNQSPEKKRQPHITLELRKLDLSILKLLQPSDADFLVRKGQLDGDVACVLDKDRKLHFGANVRASKLNVRVAGKSFKNLGFQQKISGSINKDFFISVPKYFLDLKNKQKDILSFDGAASIDLKKRDVNFSLNMYKISKADILNYPLPKERIKQIFDITSKLKDFFLSGKLNGNLNLDTGKIKLNPVVFNISQENKSVINLSIQPEGGRIRNLAKKSTFVLTFKDLSTGQFKRLLNDNTMTSGRMNGKIIANVKDDFNNIKINTSLNIEKLKLLRMRKIFDKLRFHMGFSTSIINLDEIKIRDFVIGVRKQNKLILGFSGLGNMEISKGAGKLDLTMDYLNHQSINIITPGKLKNGVLKGNLKIDFMNKFRNLKIKSKLNMEQLLGGNINEAINGTSSFDMELRPDLFFCREFIIDLNNKEGEIISVNGSTTLPKHSSENLVVVKLNSKIIDIDKIKKLFATKKENTLIVDSTEKTKKKTVEKGTKKETKKVEKHEPLEFDFGGKTYVLYLDLRGIKYSSLFTAHLNSEVIGKKRSLKVKHLQLVSNKDKVDFKGDFLSTPKGIKYNVDLKSDKLNLNPIFHTFLRENLQKMKATLKNFHLKLNGTGLLPLALWDNMKGYVVCDFQDVKIPNDLSKTSMGKIFLLPFEIMVEIQKMIPDKAVQAMGKAARYVLEFQRDMKVLNFTKGKMHLKSADGIINIIDFQLDGKVVKDFKFAGKFGLGTRQLLDLTSSLNVNGIVMPVEMSGTVDNPDINYSATTLKLMSSNASLILNVTEDILGKQGGKAKEILDTLFK